jgi:hypothetical protein
MAVPAACTQRNATSAHSVGLTAHAAAAAVVSSLVYVYSAAEVASHADLRRAAVRAPPRR